MNRHMPTTIISKRVATVRKDLPSFRLTLTQELLDLGYNEEDDYKVSVTLQQNGPIKQIVIEPIVESEN